MNRLEQWRDNDVISLIISEPALKEATHGNNPRRTEKAYEYIYSMTLADQMSDNARFEQIERILFPVGAKTQNERNDVEIVFNAAKYNAILVTNDGGSKSQPGGILGNAESLLNIDIRVMRDDEAVRLIEEKIKKRDERARRIAEYTEQQLPDWVGKD